MTRSLSVLGVLADADFHTRATPYSYTCNGCNRCCHDKRIFVNPYEVARIARALGTTTTQVIKKHTDDGTSLAVTTNGACTFLGAAGCTIHSDRPLACRLYPLGRVVLDDETELFINVRTHPDSLGNTGVAGTIDSYLATQDIGPHVTAARAYRVVLAGWAARIHTAQSHGSADDAMHHDTMSDSAGCVAGESVNVLDVDAAVTAACARMLCPEPTDLDERVRIHVEWLRDLGDTFTDDTVTDDTLVGPRVIGLQA